MPTKKADITTLARFGDYESFKTKFISDDIIKKDEFRNKFSFK